ncbi:hypothetical protein DI291_13660 [Bacillus paralicheniformis]|nr:hypothetical protein BLMD_13445 [Bacillus paralicheniformis]AUZ39490.1 hypothetical protein C1T29_14855 [Bacillus sp. MBGLi79]KUL17230.1 hypothetical protein LI6934_12655 [Bacillus licheniformis LMG 6934]POO80947.1 hypothetical protein C1T30_19545 [Bacillus sp. MBGLi97]AYQ17037.1 hypothetical protein D5285_13630 [Bacillus paralicheniformis]
MLSFAHIHFFSWTYYIKLMIFLLMIYKYPTIITTIGQQEKSLTIYYFKIRMFVFCLFVSKIRFFHAIFSFKKEHLNLRRERRH